MSPHPALRVECCGSGFVIEGGPGGSLQAVRGARGSAWEIASPDRAWLLRRSARGEGLELLDEAKEPEGNEPICYLFRAGRYGATPHVLAEDGRLFRIVLRDPRDPRYELVGWEGPGPYLVARPEEDGGWRVEATVAGDGLEEIRALTVLFVAEILDQDGTLSFGESA